MSHLNTNSTVVNNSHRIMQQPQASFGVGFQQNTMPVEHSNQHYFIANVRIRK